MRSLDLVHSYFDREAERFDAIYEKDKPLHQQIGDAVFRRVIHERYSLVINAITALDRTALDVGCGPGRYGLELARRKAKRCLGVDVSEQMVAIGRAEAEKAGVADRCAFEVSDFLSWKSDEQFDAVIAMGYFDYLEDPLPHLKKMIARSRGQVFCSLPKRWELRTPLRLARFALANGFVRFYSRAEVLDLCRDAFDVPGALGYVSLVDLGRDYIAIINVSGARAANA
jgi:2-polyprenyl-3-methyl-5-hydroxy-6-metoxy-1,4-benzoquinol methylase